MIIKQFYETPEAEILEVNFEECILSPGTEYGNPTDPFSQSSAPRQSIWHYMDEK